MLILLVTLTNAQAQNIFPAIGLWREHAPYQSTIDVTASAKKIYAATPYNLFSVDIITKEIERISKVSGLSETGISTIKYDALSQKLFVAYSNSNIDVLDESGVHNIPGLKRATLAGDKTIYHIYPDNQLVYLSTGIGIVVLDANKFEIKETWLIGNNGGFLKTYGFTKHNNFFYAATDVGLKRTAATGGNAANYINWQTLSGANGLTAAASKAVVSFQNKLITLQNDSLFVQSGNTWSLFFANDFPIININVSENKLIVAQRKPTGESRVVVLNADASVNRILQQPAVISFPKNGIAIGNQYWIADAFGGLSEWNGTAFEVYKPNSPNDVMLGQMLVYNNILYATAGTVNDAWNYQYNRSGFVRFANGGWEAINAFRFPQLDTLLDFITIAIDPRDETVWAGSYGGGLLHLKKNNELTIYKRNATLEATIGDPLSYRVAGLAFDADNNLWISNFGAGRQLHVRKNDGSFKAFAIPFFLNNNAVAQIIIDDAQQKWIVSPTGNGLIVFNDNNTIDNTADDKWRLFKTGVGAGNLPSNDVTYIAKDKSGFIWVGTANGIAVFQCAQDVFTSGCEAVLPIISETGFANFLFKGEAIRSIAVDGADRKWVATADGVWLVSAAGDKVLQHFTETNSPLLSSDVKSIAINGSSGEVFFGTAKGISSYRSTATEATENKNEVLVFPNPVPPNYGGSIAIKGLPENSIVKITELNGRLVFQTRSLGGQAVWNARDYKGGQAAAGVYLVFAVNDLKTEKAVAKIVFVGR